MRVLFVGDVVGRPGREVLRVGLPVLKARFRPDMTIVNGENAAGGIGITGPTAREILGAGADVITGGNHSLDKREILTVMDRFPTLLRPVNYPEENPGRGVCVHVAADGTRVGVISLQGRVFMEPIDDPFRTVDRLIDDLAPDTDVLIVDFHAEATSEKIAMGWHLDGRVAAVLGTHTHVPTADERVLPGGAAYVTDVGMTGPYDSVIGIRKDQALERFRTQRPVRYSVADGDCRVAAVCVDIDPAVGRARDIRRVDFPSGDDQEMVL